MFNRGPARGNSGGYSPNTGSTLFREPPHWVDVSRYQHPVLYAHPSFFTPLAQASVRGMKDTVKSILENNRKQQMKKLKKHNKSENEDEILVGDHSNEEFAILLDDGYSQTKELPTQITISPLQIACSEYMGTSLQKYLTIVELLVSYGANIHQASWYTTTPPPEAQQTLDAVGKELSTTRRLKAKFLNKINELETKSYSKHSDQQQRLNDIKLMDRMHVMLHKQNQKEHHLAQRQRDLIKACTKKKMVNDSAYVMALRHRTKCNDTELIGAMIKGSLVIKKSIVKSKGVGSLLSEEIIQVIVEYCNGLSLKLWDL